MSSEEKKEFDFSSFEAGFSEQLKKSGALLGKDGALTPLIKHLLEGALEAELDDHLAKDPKPNRRNGKGSKKVKTPLGKVDIETPRDRNSSFEPKILAKRQTVLGVDLDRQVLALYSHGSSYADIQAHLSEMYDLDVSASTLSRVTDQVWPLVQQWRSRPLESLYPIVWLDALHVKVRIEGRVRTRAVYCILGLNDEGQKTLLGLYPGESEGARFWLQILSDLRDRGVEDILIACIDNLKGFAEAIETVFPRTIVQLCIVHQVRNSLKYIPFKNERAFLSDIKKVYKAKTLNEAEQQMDLVEEKWGNNYPKVISSWRNNWLRLTSFFEFSPPIRKIIYTTNIIEGFHRQLRKVLKTKGALPGEDALMKLLYLAQERIVKKWATPTRNWREAKAELMIIFEGRIG